MRLTPDFELNDRNATTIAAVCARLDGLPLAIELAAAQLRVRTLPELVADLDRRFDLLVGGKREALTHQQSLEATIDWSYELLDPAAQRLLRFVSVFSGGWSPEAADQVAADVGSVRECMMALTEQSLIRRTRFTGRLVALVDAGIDSGVRLEAAAGSRRSGASTGSAR